MKLQTKLDSTNRLVLTKEMRSIAGIGKDKRLEVTTTPGCITITAPSIPTTLVKKGNLKVIRGNLPDIPIEEAVNLARHYIR